MRSLAIVALLATSVRAEPFLLEETRDVVGRHASAARRGRIIGGGALTVSGVALGVAGGLMLANVRPGNGGALDFSGLERSMAYSMLAVGGLLALTGPLMLFKQSTFERLRDEVVTEQDARHVRTEIAHNARSGRRKRMVLRGIGVTLASVGALSIVGSSAAGEGVAEDTRRDLLGMGLAVGAMGTGFIVGSMIETRWESMHRALQPTSPPLSAGIVPTRGGAIAAIGGVF